MSLQRNLTHNFNPVIAFLFLRPLQIFGHVVEKLNKTENKNKDKDRKQNNTQKILILDYNQRIFTIFTTCGSTLLNK